MTSSPSPTSTRRAAAHAAQRLHPVVVDRDTRSRSPRSARCRPPACSWSAGSTARSPPVTARCCPPTPATPHRPAADGLRHDTAGRSRSNPAPDPPNWIAPTGSCSARAPASGWRRSAPASPRRWRWSTSAAAIPRRRGSSGTPWLLYTVIGVSAVVIVGAVPLLLRARRDGPAGAAIAGRRARPRRHARSQPRRAGVEARTEKLQDLRSAGRPDQQRPRLSRHRGRTARRSPPALVGGRRSGLAALRAWSIIGARSASRWWPSASPTYLMAVGQRLHGLVGVLRAGRAGHAGHATSCP